MSEYPEYEQLQELRAEDRRVRRDAMVLTALAWTAYQAEAIRLAGQMFDAERDATRLRENARSGTWGPFPRWYRRRLTRIAHQYDAMARSARRDLATLKHPGHRPVIKKGLTR